MNDSWAIGTPGRRMIGTELKFANSSVSVPFQPGSQNPAVAWTTRPRRPSELVPSESTEVAVMGAVWQGGGTPGPPKSRLLSDHRPMHPQRAGDVHVLAPL